MASPGELDAIEEKARQVAAKQKVKRKAMRGPIGKDLPTPPTLLSALERKRLVQDDLDELLEEQYPDPVVSLYLSLTQDKLVPEKGYLTAWHSLRHRALEAAEELLDKLSNEQKQQLEVDLSEIDEFLNNDFSPNNSRSLIILKSGDQLRLVASLPIYLRDVMVIDPRPHIKPLEEIFAEYRPVLVVRVQRGQAYLSLYQLGRWQELPAIKNLVSKASTKSSKAGKAERLYEEQLRSFHKLLADKLDQLFEAKRFTYLILIGDQSNTEPLPEHLSKKLQEHIALIEGEDPEETKNDLTARVEEVLSNLKLQHEQAVIREMEEWPDQEQLVTGLGPVLENINRFMVRRLFVSESFSKPGFICRRHNYLAIDAGKCPFCQRDLWPVRNLVESLIEAASQQNVDTTILRLNPDVLEPYGIAAITYPVDTR